MVLRAGGWPGAGNPLCLGLAHGRQGAVPTPAGGDPGVEFAQREDPGGRELVGRAVVEPTRDQIAVLRLRGSHGLKAVEEGKLARAQALASCGLAIGRERLLVDLQHHGLGEAVEAPVGEGVQGGTFGAGRLDRQAYKPPRLPALARNGSYGVHGLLVGGVGLVAVLGPEVARSAVGEIKAFGDRPQVGAVVLAEAPDEAFSL